MANGTAGEHSDIHLQLYCDSAKDVEMLLLNQGLDFEADEEPLRDLSATPAAAEEVLHVLWRERGQCPRRSTPISVHTQERPGNPAAGDRRGERLSVDCARAIIEGSRRLKNEIHRSDRDGLRYCARFGLVLAWPSITSTLMLPPRSQAPAICTRRPFPTQNGKDFPLAGLKGHVVVINFWATWCVPCVKEIPELSRMSTGLRQKGPIHRYRHRSCG